MNSNESFKQKTVTHLKKAIKNSKHRLLLQQARLSALNMNYMKYMGAPCKNGHEGVRYTASDCCVDCTAFYRDRDKEEVKKC